MPIVLELFELENRTIFQTVAQDMFNSTLFSGLFKFSGISRSSSDLVMDAAISFPHFQQLFLHFQTASKLTSAKLGKQLLDEVTSIFLLISVYRAFGSIEQRSGGLLEEDWIEHCILAVRGHLTHQVQEVWADFPKPVSLVRALAASILTVVFPFLLLEDFCRRFRHSRPTTAFHGYLEQFWEVR
jgi:hypothetical protein